MEGGISQMRQCGRLRGLVWGCFGRWDFCRMMIDMWEEGGGM